MRGLRLHTAGVLVQQSLSVIIVVVKMYWCCLPADGGPTGCEQI